MVRSSLADNRLGFRHGGVIVVCGLDLVNDFARICTNVAPIPTVQAGQVIV